MTGPDWDQRGAPAPNPSAGACRPREAKPVSLTNYGNTLPSWTRADPARNEYEGKCGRSAGGAPGTGTRSCQDLYATAPYLRHCWSARWCTATLNDVKSESVQTHMPPQPATPAAQFTQLLSATRRGARLARLLAVEQIAQWGWPPDSERAEAAAVVVAELATNAVRHGCLPGRGFRLSLVLLQGSRLRIEVTDPRGDRLPAVSGVADEGGRGLVIVDALADGWGVLPYPPSGKTVWAEVSSVE